MICPDCKGKGTFIVKETYSDGDDCLVPYECGTCEGTGQIPDPRNPNEAEDADPDGTFNVEGDDDDF